MSSSETQRALPPRKNSSPLTTVLGSTTLTSVETSNQDGNPQGGDNSVSSTLSRNTSPLDTLLSMGFARNRAEKALAATGHRGVRIASDWLLAHVNDPLLDVTTPRHYFLYLCPVQGCPLARQLQTFWDASQTQIGWNGAHNCPAHVTLVSGSGMVIPDSQVPQLISAIKKVAEDFSRDLSVLSSSKGNGVSLEKYVSPNYLGLFVGKNEEILLGSFIGALSAELSSLGIPTSGLDGPPKGGSSSPDSSITTASGRQSFHMSLAYQFSSKHYAGLQDLAETLDITSPVDWELRLYSCDAKLAPKEIDVYRVSYAHVPREEDELELMAGDLVYINKDEARMASDPESTHSDGWVVGTSWLTGSTGFLPKNYVERTAQVNACTLHLTIPLNGQESLNKNGSSNLTGQNFMGLRGAPEKQSLLSLSSASSLEERLRETATLLPPPPQQSQEDFPTTPSEISNLDHLDQTSSAQTEQYKEATCDENEFKPSNTSSDICSEQGNPTAVENYGPRQIYVVRHGERVDFTFGTWIPYSFDIKTHEYTRKDLNMPLKENIPLRAGGPEMFAKDCPLTRMGCIQAQLTGEAMRDNGVSISHVYVSPSLRCIQTAHHILQGLGKSKLKMHIEPGLFEWLAWYQDAMPNWMSVPDLVKAGYNIDENYEPYISADELQDAQAQLQQPESVEQYYTRNFFVTRCILQATEPGKKIGSGGGNLLFVAHAASLDACSRQVVGKEPRSLSQMMAIVREVAYCGVALLEEDEDEEDTKSLMSSVADGMSVKSFKKKKLWKMKETPFPPLTHCSNSRFDSKILME